MLRNWRLGGFRFRRQHPVAPFILDFHWPAARLAIELAGGQHYEAPEMVGDSERTPFWPSAA